MDFKFKFSLGSVLEEDITGFTGVVVSRTQWLSNCNTYGLKSKKLKYGIPQDLVYFDEPRLKIVEERIYQESRATGGPTEKVLRTNR